MNKNMKKIKSTLLILSTLLTFNVLATDVKILEKFSEYDYKSDFVIHYDDVNTILKASVLYMGKSTRDKAKKAKASIGTKFRNKVNPLTDLEGNRFYYEEFNTPEKVALITNVRKSLERLPANAPLHLFKKDEQLAYWLNLYNISLLEQLVNIYPKKNLKSLIEEDGFLDTPHLIIDNEKLSLNDIKNIVTHNYGYDPILIYGFHQGHIASPDLRTSAYTGENVWSALKKNANLFINSNRGTFSDDSSTLRVSYLYEQNSQFFPNFETDLKAHLANYLTRYYKEKLLSAKKLKTNITNWHISDLYGTYRVFGGGNATNTAGLLDAFVTQGAQGQGNGFTNSSAMNSNLVKFSPIKGRLDPAHLEKIVQLVRAKEVRKGSVTIKDDLEGNN